MKVNRYIDTLAVIIALVVLSTITHAQNVGINGTGATPNSSAMLDVSSTTKGMLIPRMTHTQMYAISSPATGLMVFQTDNTPGFYYYDGSEWQATLSATNSWAMGGNSEINPALNFMGTTDSTDIVIKTNDFSRMIINAHGYVGVGTASPSSLFSAGTASQFQVNPSGDLVSIKGVTYSWPSSNPGTGITKILQNDGSGNLSWATPAAGTVTGVSASAPFTSSGGTTPTISLTGTIGVANGGTGATTLTSNGIIYGNGTSAISATAAGSQNQLLSANSSGIPTWTTATYPSTTTTNQILYSSATNTVAGITTANNGILITNGSGVPSWLAAGTNNYVLTMSSGVPTWAASPSNFWTLTGNSGTTAGTNFIGTTDATDFVIKTGSTPTERLRFVNSSGNIVIGSGEGTGTVSGNTLRGPNSSGTNIAGSNLTITSGDGTGTGGSGYISFQTAAVGTTGTTANTMAEAMRIINSGNVGIGTSTPGNKLEINSGTGGVSGLRLKQMPSGAILFMSSTADVTQNNNNLFFDATNYRLGVACAGSASSTIQDGGSLGVAIVTKTAGYTASGSDHTILCNTATAGFTITLPVVTGCTGRIYVIKKVSSDANAVTVQINSGADRIDGATTYTLSSQYNSVMIQSDGAAWDILATH